MENQLKCFPILSLEEMSLRRVVAHLWSGSDILASISKLAVSDLRTEKSRKDWRVYVEEKIKDKVAKLKLPKTLSEEMNEIVRPIGLEVKQWKHFHECYLSSEDNHVTLPGSTKLFWTTAGSIDYRKTAEELVRCNALDIVHRYQLACLNCLEDDIPLIWKRLSEESKGRFLRLGEKQPELTICWSYIITGKLSQLDYLLTTWYRNLTSFNQWAFEHSAMIGNKTATKYFLQRLTYEEREASLMKVLKGLLDRKSIAASKIFLFPHEKFSDIVCSLLTLLTPEQQMETIAAYPDDVFLCTLYYPWQDLFLENAGLLWASVPKSEYVRLALKMKIRYSKWRFYSPKLFQVFFMWSPIDFKKFCIDHPGGQCFSRVFLSLLLESVDSDSIKVVFRNMDAVDRIKLVTHGPILNLFGLNILGYNWHAVEICLRETMLSREDKNVLKEGFKDFLESSKNKKGAFQRFKRCFEFLDEDDTITDKRKKAQKRKLKN